MAKERAKPEIDRRALLLPTRAQIFADEEAIGAPQIMRAAKEHRNPRLRIAGRNFRPGNTGIFAALDAFAFAVDERRRIQRADHGNAIAV